MKHILENNTQFSACRTWGLPGSLLFGLLILGANYLLSYLVYLTYVNNDYLFGRKFGASSGYDGFLLAVTSLVTLPVMFVLLALFIYLRKGLSFKEYIGLIPISFHQVCHWCGILFMLLLGSEMITWLFGRPFVPDFMAQIYVSADSPALLMVALTLAVPLSEEFLFRGFLLTGFSRSRLGWTGAIILSALLWSLIHYQYDGYDMSWVFVIGLFLGYGKKNTNSIYIPLLMHAMINALAFFGVAAYIDDQNCMTAI